MNREGIPWENPKRYNGQEERPPEPNSEILDVPRVQRISLF
jgi:hypothetical protein